jgi:hypothetical protein
MKIARLLAVSTVSAILVFLAACEQESRPSRPPVPDPTLVGGAPTPSPSPEASPTPSPTPETSPTPSAATSTPTPAASNAGTIPFGVPVPGKPGFVVSPYSQGSGYVDVRGFPPNTEVKDPYSGKTFLVP